MPAISYARFDTPVGAMRIASTDRGVCYLALPNRSEDEFLAELQKIDPEALPVESVDDNARAIAEVLAYFQGHLMLFGTSLDMRAGTPFQQQVWRAVAAIPYAETRSYGDIAREIGKPTAFRAVGAANGANPLPLFVPCHRVIGSDGSLTGFGGGMALKKQLLELEKAALQGRLPGFDLLG